MVCNKVTKMADDASRQYQMIVLVYMPCTTALNFTHSSAAVQYWV